MNDTAKPSATPDERKNGWTDETLAAYLAERLDQQIRYADRKKPRRVVVENHVTFDPHKW